MNLKRALLLGIATILLLFCGLIYAWSLFRAPFQAIYTSWSISQLSMTFTISMIFFCIGGFLSGRLLLKRSAALVISLSAVLVLAGFAGVSFLAEENPETSLVMLYLCYGVLGGTGIGLSYNAILSTIGKMFPDRPGLASGIMMMGFGMGGLVLGSLVTGMIGTGGLFRSFGILAVVMFVVLLAGAQAIGAAARGEKPAKAAVLAHEGLSTAEMLKTSSFWIFIVWNVVTNSAGLMVINSAASIAAAFGAPAIMGMIVSLFNGFGRVIIGGIYDKSGREKTMVFDCLLQIGSGLLLIAGAFATGALEAGTRASETFTTSAVLIIGGLLLAGLFYGGSPTIAASFIKREFGDKYYSVNFSVANFSLIPAALIGPTLSSTLIERAGGSYFTTCVVSGICGLISISTLPFLKKSLK